MRLTDCGADVSRVRGGFTQQVLQLGEDLFDRVQVGGVFGQEEELGAGRANGLAHRSSLMTSEIVQNDNVARSQGWDENLVDIEPERLAVDGTGEQPWRIDAVVPESGEEGHRLPSAVRNLRAKPATTKSPPPQRRHVGFGPGLVDEDQAGRFNPVLTGDPLRAPSGDVGTVLFAGVHGFF